MSDGQLALNTNLVSPGLFFKDSNGDSVKIGPVHVGTTAPNVTPGAGGQAGNSKGEQWLDTSSSRYVFKIWDGTAWRSEDGEFVNVSGDTMTGALVVPLASAATPSLTFTGDLNTGIYSPGADQLAVATNGAQRVSIDSAGKVSLTGDIEFSRTNPAAITVDGNGSITLSADSANTGAASNININVDGLEVADFNNAGYLRFNRDNFGSTGICTQQSDNALALGGGANPLNSGINIALSGPDRVSTYGYLMRWNTTNLYRWDKTSDFHAWYTGAASERLRITSAGLVGIGTSAPTALLHLSGTTTAGGIKIVDSSSSFAAPGIEVIGKRIDGNVSSGFAGKLLLSKNRTDAAINSANVLGSVAFGGNHTDGTEANILYSASIVGAADGAFNSATDMPTALVFNTGATGRAPDTAGVTTGTERLRITSAGLVGIGTSAPTAPLTVIGANNATQAIFGGLVGTTDRGLRIATGVFSGNNDIAILDAQFSTGTLAFQTASTERMRITSTGNVGIGTNAPAGSLNVSSNTAGNPSLTYDTSNIANFDYGTIQLALGINAAAPYGAFLQARDNTNAARVISLNPSGGNVGIGVTNPGSALEINAAAATSPFIAKINTSEVARIDSGGRLLVGTSSAYASYTGTPSFQLSGIDISTGSSLYRVDNNATSTVAPVFTFGRTRGATKGTHGLVSSGDYLGFLSWTGSDGTNFIPAVRIDAQVDGTPGANAMPGRIVLSTTAVGASSPTERMRIHSDGNVSIGSASNTGDQLYVNGTIRSNGQIQTLIGDTDTAPGYTWQGDEDTGMFRTGIDSLGFSAGGSEIARFNFDGTSSRRQLYFENTAEIWSAGSLYLEGVTSVRSVTIKDDTTANAANVFISSSAGTLQRSTSSIKYKTDVEDAELSYSETLIYGSRPVWYRSLSENDPSEYSYWGFIAEEVAEIDPRMVHWGDDGPEGVQYDRYVVHLVSVIQKQKQRLDALEARLTAAGI
jgi:hypothetical protein